MTGKKTMFGMGNQFNGFAEEKYLKGLENRTHGELPQGNVKLSKTFTEALPKASGALPDVINANIAMADTQKALGAIVQTLYVSLTVDKKSKSVVQGYNVVGSGAYSGAYLQGYTDTLFYANSGAVNFECWYLNRDGTWSYYKTDLPVQNDWVQADGEWYFFNGAGIMWTGWLDWNGYKYYMRSCKEWDKELKIYVENGGQMTVGWKKIADKWYYFKSHIVNGEQKGGQMVTGWRQIPESDNKYFYFYSDGEMAENVLIEYKGDYYFLKDGGYMAENEEITDPKTNKIYKAGSTGICTEIGKGSGGITVPHISYKFTSMAVCTDGYDDSYETSTYQQSLAGFNVDKNDSTTPSATKVPYIVIAKNHPDVNQRLRDYGVIIDHATGKYVYAIVAESGPDNEYREISIKAAWDLGINTDGTWGPTGDFEFIIFTGTSTLNYNAKEADILKGIKEEASKYYP